MTNLSELHPVPSDDLAPAVDPLRLAVAAYLARFTGASRDHTHSDLRCYLTWWSGCVALTVSAASLRIAVARHWLVRREDVVPVVSRSTEMRRPSRLEATLRRESASFFRQRSQEECLAITAGGTPSQG